MFEPGDIIRIKLGASYRNIINNEVLWINRDEITLFLCYTDDNFIMYSQGMLLSMLHISVLTQLSIIERVDMFIGHV